LQQKLRSEKEKKKVAEVKREKKKMKEFHPNLIF
jgi:hypothetical protein